MVADVLAPQAVRYHRVNWYYNEFNHNTLHIYDMKNLLHFRSMFPLLGLHCKGVKMTSSLTHSQKHYIELDRLSRAY